MILRMSEVFQWSTTIKGMSFAAVQPSLRLETWNMRRFHAGDWPLPRCASSNQACLTKCLMIEHILTTHLNWFFLIPTIGDHRPNLGRSAMASGAPLLAPEPNAPNSSDDVVFWELLSSHFITRCPKFLEGTCTIWEAISNGDFMVMLQGKYSGQSICNWEDWIYGCIQKGTPWGRVRWVRGKMSVRNKQIYDLCTLIRIQIKTLVDILFGRRNCSMDGHNLFFFGPPLWSRVFYHPFLHWVKSQHFLRNPSGPSIYEAKRWVTLQTIQHHPPQSLSWEKVG